VLKIFNEKGNFMKKIYWFFLLLFTFGTASSWLSFAHAEDTTGLSKNQMIYVPAYSHIYIGDNERPFLLTVTLSIRNIDPKHRIKITRVDYFESQGKLLKKYLNKPVTLNPLESVRYVVPESDKTGGSGANFMVEWKSDDFVNPPIAESIMIGTQSQQGISFTSRGQAIIPSE
jgi:hypothetical protein